MSAPPTRSDDAAHNSPSRGQLMSVGAVRTGKTTLVERLVRIPNQAPSRSYTSSGSSRRARR
jgi:hypothetical protein